MRGRVTSRESLSRLRASVSRALGRHPVAARSAAAVLAGLLLFGSFPPRPWWFLAPLGIAVLTLTVCAPGRLRGGFGYGFLAGLGFFVPLLPWTGIYVGPLPWLALSAVCALYVGAFGLGARLVGTLRGGPLWVALAWASAEWARSSFPFGGFPWGRLAFGQADGWYLALAALGGAPLIGFAVALTGTCVAALARRVIRERGRSALDEPRDRAADAPRSGVAASEVSVSDASPPNVAPPNVAASDVAVPGVAAPDGCGEGSSASGVSSPHAAAPVRAKWARYAGPAIVAALMPLAGLLMRAALPAPDAGDRTITVAAIQGSVPRLGLDFNAQRRAVLDNHVRRTRELAAEVAAGRAPKPDVVVWPENSSDIDPLRNSDAAALITAAATEIGAPILVGAVLVNANRTTTNSVIVWSGAAGPGERHDKKIIQPFGEYLPMRGFFRLFSDYADRAGYFVPGDGDGVVHAAGIPIGVATCYEVAFDRAFEDAVRAGAQLLAVPTNNATFGESEMTYQQLAMSRVRAVEHGRALVVAATSGVSAIITADGVVRQESPLLAPAALVARLPLRTSDTVATRVGPAPEGVFVVLTAAAVLAAVVRRGSARNSGPTGRVASAGSHALATP